MDRKFLLEKYRLKKASTKGRVDVNGDLIEMRLTEDQWCQLWEEARVIPSRNYVISRKNDTGHYEIGNVYIQHNLHNVTEALTDNSDLEYKITEYAIKTGYKRRIVKAMIKRGEITL
jgi:predicted RNA polymerase sigma factor